jgi:hypothetical protein
MCQAWSGGLVERSINDSGGSGERSVVVSAAGAVVTNLITSKWSLGLALLLAGLVLAGSILAGLTAVPFPMVRRRTAVSQVARGGVVVNSVVEADAGARVDERAGSSGEIRDVHTKASDANVRRVARDGKIEGGSITAS